MYMQHQVWKPDEEDPRGLGGDQISMALSSWTLLYGYLGDPAVRANMTYMADYWLARIIGPRTTRWGNLPYPYNMVLHRACTTGTCGLARDFSNPTRRPASAAELVVLYKMTGEREVPPGRRRHRRHLGG